jgi:hypothetical protein
VNDKKTKDIKQYPIQRTQEFGWRRHIDKQMARTILMVKSEKKTRESVWLTLRGYHVVALKPDFDEHAMELERAIQQAIPSLSGFGPTGFL